MRKHNKICLRFYIKFFNIELNISLALITVIKNTHFKLLTHLQ